MSVVVAIKKDGVVYMGADSQVSRGGTRMTLSNPNNYKIWSLCDVDYCVMGSVGALRANNVIKVADNLIPESVDIKGTVDFRFVCTGSLESVFILSGQTCSRRKL